MDYLWISNDELIFVHKQMRFTVLATHLFHFEPQNGTSIVKVLRKLWSTDEQKILEKTKWNMYIYYLYTQIL